MTTYFLNRNIPYSERLAHRNRVVFPWLEGIYLLLFEHSPPFLYSSEEGHLSGGPLCIRLFVLLLRSLLVSFVIHTESFTGPTPPDRIILSSAIKAQNQFKLKVRIRIPRVKLYFREEKKLRPVICYFNHIWRVYENTDFIAYYFFRILSKRIS